MQLTQHFNTKTDRLLITVVPTDIQLNNLKFVCNQLELVRDKFGLIFVTSGLRKPKIKYSQHQDGYAIDFTTPKADIKEVFNWMIINLKFDQLILEHDVNSNQYWIHYSVKEYGNRRQCLTAEIKNNKPYYYQYIYKIINK